MSKKTKQKEQDDTANLALLFRALADPTRLRIYRFLCTQCSPVAVEDGEEVWMPIGPTAGEVCFAVSGSAKITALVSHHLKEMRMAGLIAVKRRGKNMICGVRREACLQMSQFLGEGILGGEAPLVNSAPVSEAEAKAGPNKGPAADLSAGFGLLIADKLMALQQEEWKDYNDWN